MFGFQAVATRDAMAKCLYGALFDWIVLQVNHALLSKREYQEHKVRNKTPVEHVANSLASRYMYCRVLIETEPQMTPIHDSITE